MQGVGDTKNSEGSDWIIKELEGNDERPLWISVWGGANALAQALYKIKNTKTEKEAKRLIANLGFILFPTKMTAESGLETIFLICFISSPREMIISSATWNAINRYVHGVKNEKISKYLVGSKYSQGHGPLGAAYPDVAWGMEREIHHHFIFNIEWIK